MNLAHRWLCRSAFWKNAVAERILPWALDGVDLGSDVLEIGPGPGVTTDVLQRRVTSLTCVEIDQGLARSLARRTSGSNVTVICADATAMPLPSGTFDAALSLTVLHHVPTAALQDRLLGEAARVLKVGGVFAGTDSLAGPALRLLHAHDTYVPVDPAAFAGRLQAAGFTDVRVDTNSRAFRFVARR